LFCPGYWGISIIFPPKSVNNAKTPNNNNFFEILLKLSNSYLKKSKYLKKRYANIDKTIIRPEMYAKIGAKIPKSKYKNM